MQLLEFKVYNANNEVIKKITANNYEGALKKMLFQFKDLSCFIHLSKKGEIINV